jgi:hypothetical protein
MHDPAPHNLSRRDWLKRAGCGAGYLGLIAAMAQEGLLRPAKAEAPLDPLAAKPSHFPAKAKSVIWIFVNGGPSPVDTWDYKPALEKHDGKSIKEFDPEFQETTGFFKDAVGGLMKSPFAFSPRGQCGKMVSSIFPKLGEFVDDMAFIHSGFSESNNHAPALLMMNCGLPRMGYPCVGAWATYGLGSESRDLPAFVVMTDPKGRGLPKGNANNWSAGFLPGVYQGTHLKPQGEPIEYLTRPGDLTADLQRSQLDLLRQLENRTIAANPQDGDLAARIESFELAFRMQAAAPETLDVNRESAETLAKYGVGVPHCDHFARQCLTARRLVERGVRFVQIYSGGMENQRSWDGHADIQGNHSEFALESDQPVAALLDDLKRSGMLDETLVIWCGEFGRLPIAQKGEKPGRDHNPHALTAWLAGGGVKGGVTYGASDEIGFKAVENRVHINDLHATILHLMGLDHERLTYRYSGRDFRLTDVAGNVIREIVT